MNHVKKIETRLRSGRLSGAPSTIFQLALSLGFLIDTSTFHHLTENALELNHEGLATIESCLLVNCFIEFSLVAARHSSDGKVLLASLLAIACRIWRRDLDDRIEQIALSS
jgi:hypothetical protein